MAEHCECANQLARLVCRREAVQKRHLAGWQERPAGHYADCLEDIVEDGVLLEGVLHVPGVGHRRLPRPRPRDRGNSEFVAIVWS